MLETKTRHEITFRGRGHGVIHGKKLRLTVCPLCSQQNTPASAEKGICHWCAYEPSMKDVEPAPPAAAIS